MTSRHHIHTIHVRARTHKHTHTHTQEKDTVPKTVSKLTASSSKKQLLCFYHEQQQKKKVDQLVEKSKPLGATNQPSLLVFQLTIATGERNAITGQHSDTALSKEAR